MGGASRLAEFSRGDSRTLYQKGYDYVREQVVKQLLEVDLLDSSSDNLVWGRLWAECHSSQFDYGDFERGMEAALRSFGLGSTCPWPREQQ